MRTFGQVKYLGVGNCWLFEKVEPHVMIKIKAIFTKIAKSQVCPFTLQHSPEGAVDLAWFLDRYPLEISEADRAFLYAAKEGQLAKVAALEQFFKPNYTPKVFDLKKPLRKYQSQAVELYLQVQRLLIGDVVGLGKTVDAIGSWCDSRTLPAAVVVQTHLTFQWKEKIEEFSNLKAHIVKNGPVYQLPDDCDVYIFKYTQLAKWVDILSSGVVKSITFDEVQEFRRCESQKYQAGRAISEKVDFVMGLSATPVYNYGDEIWNVLDLLKPGCLDTKTNFTREWCNGWGNIVTNPKALGSYLRENHLFLRRTREDVGMELPEVNRIVETVDYDEEAINKIEDVAKMLAVRVLNGSFIEKGQASRDLDMMVRHATGVSKAKPIANYVRMMVEAGEPVLLAGWHRDVYDIWNAELKDLNPVMYTGSESPTQKEKAKQQFMNGETDIMMISLRSGIGLDGLQNRASIVVIGELDWSPQIHEQIIGRLNRDGQKHQVTVVFLVSDSGSDPGIVDVLGLKSAQATGIMDPFAGAQTVDTDTSRIKRLAETFLKTKEG